MPFSFNASVTEPFVEASRSHVHRIVAAAGSRSLARVNLQPNALLAVQGEPPAVGKPVHEEQTKVLVPVRIFDAPRIESERPSAVSHHHPQELLVLLKA
jgi:hypothetical protein